MRRLRAACKFVRSQVVEALEWYTKSWKPIESPLHEAGFRFDKFVDYQPPVCQWPFENPLLAMKTPHGRGNGFLCVTGL